MMVTRSPKRKGLNRPRRRSWWAKCTVKEELTRRKVLRRASHRAGLSSGGVAAPERRR